MLSARDYRRLELAALHSCGIAAVACGELECILEPLYVVTLTLHRTLYRYELLAALGHDWDFVQRINGTTAAPPLNTVKGCVNTAIVMSLCAFFDKEAAAVNLKSILNDLRLNQRRR